MDYNENSSRIHLRLDNCTEMEVLRLCNSVDLFVAKLKTKDHTVVLGPAVLEKLFGMISDQKS